MVLLYGIKLQNFTLKEFLKNAHSVSYILAAHYLSYASQYFHLNNILQKNLLNLYTSNYSHLQATVNRAFKTTF